MLTSGKCMPLLLAYFLLRSLLYIAYARLDDTSHLLCRLTAAKEASIALAQHRLAVDKKRANPSLFSFSLHSCLFSLLSSSSPIYLHHGALQLRQSQAF